MATYAFSYKTLGLDVRENNIQSRGVCPQCYEHALYINNTTGQWTCNGCHTNGNLYNMLDYVHTESLKQTTNDDYIQLYKEKQVLPQTLKMWGYAKNYLTGEWVMPVYNIDGKIANLHRYASPKPGSKPIMMSHPKCHIHPFGLQFLKDGQRKVWIAEGAWDTPSLYDALCRTSCHNGIYELCVPNSEDALIHTEGVLGSPGAMMWRAKWYTYIKDRQAVIAFDNDHPKYVKDRVIRSGYDGAIRAASLAGVDNAIASISMVQWGDDGYDPELPNKYDIRDLSRDDGMAGALHHLNACAIPYHISTTTEDGDIDPQRASIECTSYGNLLKAFEGFHITDKWNNTFTSMLAVNLSTRMDGDPVWLRVIGPPGCGKTVLAECISYNRKYSKPVSSLTGIKSGYAGGRMQADGKRKDSSLIPLINNKNLMIKDGDTLMNGANLDQILAEFRDVFDGATRSHYRNAQGRDYEDIKSSFTLCGTNQLRLLNRANLGERFIDIEIVNREDRDKLANAASLNSLNKLHESVRKLSKGNIEQTVDPNSPDMIRKRTTAGYLDYLHNNMYMVDFPESIRERITHISNWVAHIRSRVHADEIDTKPDIEFHSRVSSQLNKLGYCLAMIHGKRMVDLEILRTLKFVAWYTADGHQRNIAVQIYKHPSGVRIGEIATKLNMPEKKVREVLDEMQYLDLVTNKTVTPKHAGRPARRWHLTDKLRELSGYILTKA